MTLRCLVPDDEIPKIQFVQLGYEEVGGDSFLLKGELSGGVAGEWVGDEVTDDETVFLPSDFAVRPTDKDEIDPIVKELGANFMDTLCFVHIASLTFLALASHRCGHTANVYLSLSLNTFVFNLFDCLFISLSLSLSLSLSFSLPYLSLSLSLSLLSLFLSLFGLFGPHCRTDARATLDDLALFRTI